MRNLTRMAICAALTAICAQIIIPLPFSPVPFSGSIIGVFLTGALLNPKCAFGAQLVYLALGSIGLPVFTGFSGGLGIIAGPTGGYLIAYPFMALVGSAILRSRLSKSLKNYVISMVPALAVCYAIGTPMLSYSAGLTLLEAFLAGVAPFLILDLMKIILASWLACRVSAAIDIQ